MADKVSRVQLELSPETLNQIRDELIERVRQLDIRRQYQIRNQRDSLNRLLAPSHTYDDEMAALHAQMTEIQSRVYRIQSLIAGYHTAETDGMCVECNGRRHPCPTLSIVTDNVWSEFGDGLGSIVSPRESIGQETQTIQSPTNDE